MDQFLIDIFGYIGAILVGILLMPQIVHTYNTKKTDGLSYIFLGISTTAAIFMLIYGFLITSIPVMTANSMYLLCNIMLIIMKYKYDNIT